MARKGNYEKKFNVNLEDIESVLERNKKRDDFHRGGQPELILSCFSYLKNYKGERIKDNGKCMSCRHYRPKCRLYLTGFKKEGSLFMKLGI